MTKAMRKQAGVSVGLRRREDDVGATLVVAPFTADVRNSKKVLA
ncbi:MAG TPA: hypothetical protein VKP67_04845 [Xanthobacteraceae bacterium]|nr:hypothetical protein [Xanthobacteraceae bacterium]